MATADEYAAWIVKNADKKGTPEFDIVASAYKDARGTTAAAAPVAPAPTKPFGQQINDAISDVPRQFGLTARYGLEGVGNVANMVASPIRAGLNAMLPKTAAIRPINFEGMADAAGLPAPRTSGERMVGDGARMVAGALVPIGIGAGVARATTGTTQAVARMAAANPAQQLVSAGSAGAAGGYVRETGGDEGSQVAAQLIAGIAAPYAMNKAQSLAGSAVRAVRSASALSQTDIDIKINSALQSNGLTLGDLPAQVQAGMRKDVADAYKLTGNLSLDAVRRLADYRLVGATPTAGPLSQDPAIFTRQKNLAKQGINSKDVAAQALGQTENQNNKLLIGQMNELGAGTPDAPIVGGRKLMNALGNRIDRAKTLIDGRYTAARGTAGRPIDLDPHAFTNNANNLLDEAMIGGKLPADVRNKLNAIASGNHPLNVDIAEQLKTRIGALQRSSQDGQERLALGMVRKALDDTPLLNDGAGLGAESITAFNRARKLNRAWEGIVERTPALQAVRDGVEPDKFVQQFVIGGGNKANTADLAALHRSIKGSPDAVAVVREQIAAHLKGKAVNGAADEVANVSQSAYNKALNAIGDEKLSMYFNKDEVTQLKAIGRVASYEQVQPKGSAVNNSNTAGTAIASILDRIGGSPLLSKIPFGNALSQPAQNISVGIRSRQAMSVPEAIAGNRLAQPKRFSVSPLIVTTDDEKNKNALAQPPR